LTEGKRHEVNVARTLKLPKESIVVMDRGYNDYGLFEAWDEAGVYFVTRMKTNARYRVEADLTGEQPSAGVISDQVVRLGDMDRELRRIEWRDPDTGEVFVFLTNHFAFAASTIAAIYRERWQIEIFFRTLKQNLRIKTFVGTSANAVRIQIWTALLAMLLLQFMRFRSSRGWVLAHMVALLRWNLFSHRDLWTWLNDPFHTPPEQDPPMQLVLDLDSTKPLRA
jgi:IS4 transposase